jgi:hypothetical protein
MNGKQAKELRKGKEATAEALVAVLAYVKGLEDRIKVLEEARRHPFRGWFSQK